MPMHRDCFSHNLKVQLDNDPKIRGIEEFKSQLESDYFAEVQVRNCSTINDQANLIIELDSSFSLREIIFFLKNKDWGKRKRQCAGIDITNFSKAINELRNVNDAAIDVEEFSLFLKDSSIIIKKIYHNSIEEQLLKLLDLIVEHYNSITKNHTETPYELYIPVFEEDLLQNDIKIAAIEQDQNDKTDYFGFWGLYFESEEDAVIYELSKKRIITGELLMLNH